MADSVTVTLPDSVSLTVTASEATALTVTAPASSSLSVTNKGPKGDKGDTGATGATGAAGSDGQGVPTGGVEGQVIVKQSATDYDTAWDYVESVYLQIQNNEGSTLSAGTPLYAKGISGASILVGAACANDSAKMPVVGILLEETLDGANGEAIVAGLFNKTVTGLTGVSVGDIVYVGSTGGLTTTKPSASTDLIQNVGIVLQTTGTNIQKMKVSAIGRTNDIPNLASGKFFIGGTTGQVSAYTLPTADGTNGQLLQTDGAGSVTFVDFSGSPWTTSGSDIYYTTGNVGIGTTTPSEPLHVSGTARIDDDLLIIDSGQSANDGILITSNPTAYVSEHSHVSVRIGRSAGQQLSSSAQKNVAIGNEALQRSTASYNVALGFRTAKGMNGGYNIVIGDFAGNQTFSPVTNPRNVILGYQAGQYSTSGDNVVIGYDSGRYTSGGQNVTIGRSAGLGTSGTSTFENTVAVGYQALTALTTGAGNTAVGYQAGATLTTSNDNTFIGHLAGATVQTNTQRCVAVGREALNSATTYKAETVAIGDYAGNTSGQASAYVGYRAGTGNTGGNYNTGIGWKALNGFGTTYSTALGYSAGTNSNGDYNVLLGASAGTAYNSSFSNTVAVGYQALTALTTGAQNTAIGYQAGDALTTGANNTLVGYAAGTALTGSSNAIFGNSAGTAMTSGTGNVVVGSYAGGNMNTNINAVAIGNGADAVAATNYGVAVGASAKVNGSAVAVGYQALTNITTGAGNTAVGYQAGDAITTGSDNTLFGYSAGGSMTGSGLTAIGYEAGRDVTTSTNGTLIGYRAGYSHVGHTNQTCIGTNARNIAGSGNDGVVVGSGAYINGSNQTAVGAGASTNNGGTSLGAGARAGTYAVAIGQGAGSYSRNNEYSTHVGRDSGNNGKYSVALGNNSLRASSTSSYYNVALGNDSGYSLTDGGSNVLIGYQAGYNLTTESNKLYIENSNSTTPLIYGEFDNDIVKINGDFEVTGGVKIEKTSNTDYDYRGDVVYFGATTSMTQGDLYYFNSSGNWAQADANAVASSGSVLLAIALGTASDTDGMLLRGTFTMEATAIDGTEATGDELYVGTTAGHVTSDVSAYTTGDIVRVIGYCLDGTNGQIWFNPSNDFITLA